MRLRRAAAFLGLVCMAFVGLNNAQSWSGAQTGAQRLAVAVAVGSGILALAIVGALWRRAAILGPLLLIWGVATAASAGLASWAWSSAPVTVLLLATGIGLALALVVGWLTWSARAPSPLR